ncbi:hypothetical protein ACV36Q_32165, partial [Pseudomonas aeruginosa]
TIPSGTGAKILSLGCSTLAGNEKAGPTTTYRAVLNPSWRLGAVAIPKNFSMESKEAADALPGTLA